jgi:hypothetical protein
MGALAGFRYRDIIKRLKALGLEFHRPNLNRYTTIPNHPDSAYCAVDTRRWNTLSLSRPHLSFVKDTKPPIAETIFGF